MIKRKPTVPRDTGFEYFPELTINGVTITKGDPIQVRYQRQPWTFDALVTNTNLKDRPQWVDAYTPGTRHGPGVLKPVRVEHVSPVPKSRKRIKK